MYGTSQLPYNKNALAVEQSEVESNIDTKACDFFFITLSHSLNLDN